MRAGFEKRNPYGFVLFYRHREYRFFAEKRCIQSHDENRSFFRFPRRRQKRQIHWDRRQNQTDSSDFAFCRVCVRRLISNRVGLAYNASHLGVFLRSGAPVSTAAAGERNVYAERLPLEEMDPAQVAYAASGVRDIGLSAASERAVVVLPCPVSYYNRPGGDVVLTVPAGKEVDFLLFDQLRYAALSGGNSFPTYTAGWRYAKPFVAAGDPEPDGPGLYVPLRTMLAVAEETAEPFLRYSGFSTEVTPQEFAVIRVLQMDWIMYSSGYYVSPDIYHEPWDAVTCCLLAAAAASAAALLALRQRRRKNALKA